MFPQITKKLGLGIGLDMSWGILNHAGPSEKFRRFIEKSVAQYSHFFFSYQPQDRNRIQAENYFEAYDRLFEIINSARPTNPIVRSMHQTVFNLGALDKYNREEIFEFTNKCIKRYDLKWINEDVGIWSIRGKSLPYPLPPLMTELGLRACIDSVTECQKSLSVPLSIEFPGFTEGASFTMGRMHAYDYFKTLAIETKSPVTLDTGHLLGYQWSLGRRGDQLYEDLARLPLENCFEIHLSGCQIVSDRFMDYHHGILLDEQLHLLEILLSRCPQVKAVTYEDPKFNDQGELIPKSIYGYNRLRDIVQAWTL